MAEKSLVKEEAEMEGVPDEVVLVDPPLLDFFAELPQAARAVRSTNAVHSVPARVKDDLMLPPVGWWFRRQKGDRWMGRAHGYGLHRKGVVPSAHATLPASIHRWRVSIRSFGHPPSQGIVPERSRARMATLCRLTSS
jgi:hypothetical protein